MEVVPTDQVRDPLLQQVGLLAAEIRQHILFFLPIGTLLVITEGFKAGICCDVAFWKRIIQRDGVLIKPGLDQFINRIKGQDQTRATVIRNFFYRCYCPVDFEAILIELWNLYQRSRKLKSVQLNLGSLNAFRSSTTNPIEIILRDFLECYFDFQYYWAYASLFQNQLYSHHSCWNLKAHFPGLTVGPIYLRQLIAHNHQFQNDEAIKEYQLRDTKNLILLELFQRFMRQLIDSLPFLLREPSLLSIVDLNSKPIYFYVTFNQQKQDFYLDPLIRYNTWLFLPESALPFLIESKIRYYNELQVKFNTDARITGFVKDSVKYEFPEGGYVRELIELIVEDHTFRVIRIE